ncbi:MAG TPA: FliA/WhiG family RNA polymerase sigma factor [Thermoanaerobacterales bacterium]|nr:FliA/WhiG family RNA polymerase sigma factor [Thermoanaerobacterales bacterium]
MYNREVKEVCNNYSDSDIDYKNKMIEKYLPLVKYVVNRLNLNLPPYLEYNDLVGYGVFGLIQAVERFEPNRGTSFETYAYARIKGSIIDELRKIDFIPQNARKKLKILQDVHQELEQKLCRTVTDEDICKHMKISMDKLKDLYTQVANLTGTMPFDDLILIQDTMYDKNQPDVQAEKQEIKSVLSQAINNLQDKEKMVITLYYYEGLTFKEIAKVLNLSQGRISQLHTKAILRLRGHLSHKMKKIK